MIVNEDSLKSNDLVNLVSHIFEVDNYRSKMGDDKDIVVLTFTVEDRAPAEDLVKFIEKGYQFVLDADMTPGELSDGKYRVFVELERTRHVSEQITEMLYGLERLTGIDKFKFRYHHEFNSIDADKDRLSEKIPHTPQDYETALQERTVESYDQFFSKSMLESIRCENDIIEFRKIYAEPIKFRIIGFGKTKEIIESIVDRIAVEYNDMAEVMYLTKVIGNYNITKLGKKFVFENQGHAVILEKL